MHDAVTEKVQGFPIEMVSPCEGTGYEIGSMSIIKGARNLESAKKFYDWALTRRRAGRRQGRQGLPGALEQEREAPPPEAPDLDPIKLIDYDFKKYGSADERTRLLKKWEDEVYSLPALRWRGATVLAPRRPAPTARPSLLWLAVGWLGFASCPGTASTTVSGRSDWLTDG